MIVGLSGIDSSSTGRDWLETCQSPKKNFFKKIYMSNCESKDRGRVLKVLAGLTDRSSFYKSLKILFIK